MKIYLVGGAVRDALLGIEVKERDWVVVGATPAQMRARGFRPVGRDFPVFLHPRTGDDYALARTERKTGPGHADFAFHAAPTVTLEEDLFRRDLTINALAKDGERLIDPYGGRRDLDARGVAARLAGVRGRPSSRLPRGALRRRAAGVSRCRRDIGADGFHAGRVAGALRRARVEGTGEGGRRRRRRPASLPSCAP